MSLKINWIGNFNPFDFISCPACGKREFISHSATSVWCDHCNTKFNVRYTPGDPGCVVDADTRDAYGPVFLCPTCGHDTATLAEAADCPHCKAPMARKEGYSKPLMERPARQWYIILKTGDYCSGWLNSGGHRRHMHDHPSCKDNDLQRQWEEFQEKDTFRIDKAALPGGLRWQAMPNGQ